MEKEVVNIPIKEKKTEEFFSKVLARRSIRHYAHPVFQLQMYDDPGDRFVSSILFSFSLALHKKRNLYLSSSNTDADLVLKRIANLHSPSRIADIIAQNYIVTIKVTKEKNGKKKSARVKLKEKYKHLPIQWGKGKPSIEDFAGIWEGRNITLESLRKDVWER